MRIKYKLTERTNKNKKREILKKVNMYKILNFKTIRYKLTASCNIIEIKLQTFEIGHRFTAT